MYPEGSGDSVKERDGKLRPFDAVNFSPLFISAIMQL